MKGKEGMVKREKTERRKLLFKTSVSEKEIN